jgi:hypothetical protein
VNVFDMCVRSFSVSLRVVAERPVGSVVARVGDLAGERRGGDGRR